MPCLLQINDLIPFSCLLLPFITVSFQVIAIYHIVIYWLWGICKLSWLDFPIIHSETVGQERLGEDWN